MREPVIPLRPFTAPSRKRTLLFGACVCAVVSALAKPAQAQTSEVPTLAMTTVAPIRVIPAHLATTNQLFDASVTGLRAYLESIKATQPQLYAQLAPDVERLESQQEKAWAVLITGLIVGVSSTIYAFASQSDCQEPSLGDPNFAAKISAWGSCTEDNMNREAKFVFIGLGAAAVGAFSSYAMAPGRSDLLEVLNKNNRLSPDPLRLQLGYDPGQHLAFAGAALSF